MAPTFKFNIISCNNNNKNGDVTDCFPIEAMKDSNNDYIYNYTSRASIEGDDDDDDDYDYIYDYAPAA